MVDDSYINSHPSRAHANALALLSASHLQATSFIILV